MPDPWQRFDDFGPAPVQPAKAPPDYDPWADFEDVAPAPKRVPDPSHEMAGEDGLTDTQRAVQQAGVAGAKEYNAREDAKDVARTADYLRQDKTALAPFKRDVRVAYENVKNGLIGGATRFAQLWQPEGADPDAQGMADYFSRQKAVNTEALNQANSDSLAPTVHKVAARLMSGVGTAATQGPAGFALDAYNDASKQADDAGLKGTDKQLYTSAHAAIAAFTGAVFQKFGGAGAGGASEALAPATVKEFLKDWGRESVTTARELGAMNLSGMIVDRLAGVQGPITKEQLIDAATNTLEDALALPGIGKVMEAAQGKGVSRSEFKKWAQENQVEITGRENAQERAAAMAKEGPAQPNEQAPSPPQSAPLEQAGPSATEQASPPTEQAGQPAAETVPGADRRVDTERRKAIEDMTPHELIAEVPATSKKVADMTPEERQAELYRSPIKDMPLPNKRAYKESLDANPDAHHINIDGDAIKYVNDNVGHAEGDKLLKAIGQSLADEGIPAFHISGDEFKVLSDNPEADAPKVQRALERLGAAKLRYTLPDGRVFEHEGAGFSYGVGENDFTAEEALKSHKSAREAEGSRAARGERPAGLVEVSPSGRKAGSNAAATSGRPGPGQPAPGPVAEEPASAKPVGFKTAKGSTYSVDENGRTTRNKSQHAGPMSMHDPKDVGLKERSDVTYYLDKDAAGNLGMHQSLDARGKRILVRDGRAYPVIELPGGKFSVAPSEKEGYPLSTKPEVGKAPLELWGNNGKGAFKSWHPGNEITEVTGGQQSPEAGSPIAFKLVDKEGRPTMETAHVEKLFPGAAIEDLGAHGFRVRFKSGKSLDIRQVPKIEMNDEQWAAAKRAYPELTDADRAKAKAAGSLEMIANGHKLDGIALMKLAAGYADDTTARHEVLHFAKKAGLFTSEEWAALVKEHSDPNKSSDAQEEDIANAREAWTGQRTPEAAPTLFSKIKDFAFGLLERAGIVDPKAQKAPGLKAEDVHSLMDTAEFWQREMKVDKSGRKFVDISFKGRPELANPNVSPEARDFANKVDEEMGKPVRKEDEAVFAAADKILGQDRRVEALKKKIADGARLNDEETVAARKLTEDAAAKAVQTGDINDILEAQALHMGYREGGSEAARAMRQRRDYVENPSERAKRAAMDVLTEPSKEAYKLIMDAKKSGSKQTVADAEKAAAKANQKLMEEMGVNAAKLKEITDPSKPEKWFEFLRDVASKKEGFNYWDAQFEFYLNSLFSAPATPAKKLLSDVLHPAWHFLVVRNVAMALNEAAGLVGKKNYEGAQLGEHKYLMQGFMDNVRKAANTAALAYKTEAPVTEYGLGREALTDVRPRAPAIPGKAGRFARTGFTGLTGTRMLNVIDTFSSSLVARMEVGAQAYRMAKKEGLAGKGLEDRIRALTDNVHSEAWDKAVEESKRLTFKQTGGKSVQGIKKVATGIKEAIPGSRYFIPTTTTPTNIMATGLEYTPAGLLMMVERYARGDKMAFKNPDKWAAQILSVGAMAALIYANDDKKKPRVTGSSPSGIRNQAERNLLLRTSPPESVRVGDNSYLRYGNVEPLAVTASILADISKAKNPEQAFGNFAKSVAEQVTSKSYMKGLDDLVDVGHSAVTGDEQALWKAAGGIMDNFVPNAVKKAAENRQEVPERSIWGVGAGEKLDRTTRRIEQGTELAKDQPKYDLWGRTIQRWGGDGVSPVQSKTTEPTKVDQMLRAYNETAEKPYYPADPEKVYTRHKQRVSMTDQQYAEYAKAAGEELSKAIQPYKWNVDNPTKQDVERFDKVMKNVRTRVLNQMLQKWRLPPQDQEAEI